MRFFFLFFASISFCFTSTAWATFKCPPYASPSQLPQSNSTRYLPITNPQTPIVNQQLFYNDLESISDQYTFLRNQESDPITLNTLYQQEIDAIKDLTVIYPKPQILHCLCKSGFKANWQKRQCETDYSVRYEAPILTPKLKHIVFHDMEEDSMERAAAIYLRNRNIIHGRPDGTFHGSEYVNRAELTKFLIHTIGPEYGTYTNPFSDVLEDQWYTQYVLEAYDRGITEGYEDGSFRPRKTVNTAEFLKMLSNTLSLQTNAPYTYQDVSASDWFAPYVGIAEQYDLFPNRPYKQLQPKKVLTRNEVALALYKILQAN